MNLFADTWHMAQRHIRALIRQPWWIAVTLVQPIIWLVLFGGLFKNMAELPGWPEGLSFREFIIPGVIVMTAFFSAGWGGMGMIDDIKRGIIDRFLVSPASRSSIINGRLLSGFLTIAIQALIALVLGWLIAMDASVDAPLPGTVMPFCGTVVPAGWAPCAGATLSVQQNAALFAAIGTAFGGNGTTTFQLPDLNGAAPVGLGPGMALGQKVPGTIDGLGLNYIINTGDLLAPGSGDGEPPAYYAYAGQVTAYAGAQIPQGWAACDGSMLAISGYPTLFQAVGDIWGGDGKTSFGLPDLRGRMMPGA